LGAAGMAASALGAADLTLVVATVVWNGDWK
jgi:hypothetical protein